MSLVRWPWLYGCALVDWIVQDAAVELEVPAGATLGTVMVDGEGDEVGANITPLHVIVVDEGDRAANARAERADFEWKLRAAWEHERARRAKRRRTRRVSALVLGLLIVVTPIGRWLSKSPTGGPCQAADDCRSGRCLWLTGGHEIVHEWVCTAACRNDGDCPTGMLCRTQDPVRRWYEVLGPDGPACIPLDRAH
jgi:hypothetical protein